MTFKLADVKKKETDRNVRFFLENEPSLERVDLMAEIECSEKRPSILCSIQFKGEDILLEFGEDGFKKNKSFLLKFDPQDENKLDRWSYCEEEVESSDEN